MKTFILDTIKWIISLPSRKALNAVLLIAIVILGYREVSHTSKDDIKSTEQISQLKFENRELSAKYVHLQLSTDSIIYASKEQAHQEEERILRDKLKDVEKILAEARKVNEQRSKNINNVGRAINQNKKIIKQLKDVQ